MEKEKIVTLGHLQAGLEEARDFSGGLAGELAGNIKDIITELVEVRTAAEKAQEDAGKALEAAGSSSGTGGGSGTGTAPGNVTGLAVSDGNQQLTIRWGDPADMIIGGLAVGIWKGTKLVVKAGSYPENETDGVLLLDNQERDRYKTNGFVLNGLTNDTEYYFSLFPYSGTGLVNVNEANRISGTPHQYRVMTAVIDLTNSNPETSVTYADDAAGMTPKSSAWDAFFGHYPVLLKDGIEAGKLDPDNFAQFEDGTGADTTSGGAGDVMIAFPRRGVKISTSGDILTVSMTDEPDNAEFTYYAHTRGTAKKDVFYLGAYKGYVDGDSKLRSLSGKTPDTSQTISAFRTCAHNAGPGYENAGFYQLVFRQVMYILKYKDLDSQSALGHGWGDTASSLPVAATGDTDTDGMDYGMTGAASRVKLFGLEDSWGNVPEWADGILIQGASATSYSVYTATNNFSDNCSNYSYRGAVSRHTSAFLRSPKGTNELGFIPQSTGSSSTTYFCDTCFVVPSSSGYNYAIQCGGGRTYGPQLGVFFCYFGRTDAAAGARLMFL